MELRHLTTFRAVATTLSFTRAAADLDYVQSAVTAHVKALEAELGVPLFDRLGRRVELTDAGRRLAAYAHRILGLADEAAASVADDGEPTGTVVVSAPEVLCVQRLPGVVKQLYRDHHGLQIVFRVNPTGALDEPVRRGLAAGEVDVAYVLAPRPPTDPRFGVEHLTDEPLVLIAAPDHPLAARKRVTAADLDGVALITTEPGCPYRATLDRVLAAADVHARVVGEFTSSEAVKRCVEAGTTIGLLAAVSVTDELRNGTLAALSWHGPRLHLASYMVWNTRRWTSPAVDTLLASTRRHLDTHL